MAVIDYDVDANDYIIYVRNALGQMDRVVDENGKTARLRAEVMMLSDEKAYDTLMRKLVAAVERREGPDAPFGLTGSPCQPAPPVGPIRGKMKNGEWFDATDQDDVRRAEETRQREKAERHGAHYGKRGTWKVNIVWPTDEELYGSSYHPKRNGRMWVDDEEIDINRTAETMNDIPEWAREELKRENTRPAHEAFNEALLRDVAATMGMSYEDVLGRYNDIIDPVPPVTPEDLSAVIKDFEKPRKQRPQDNGHPRSPRKGDRSNRR